MIAVADAGDVRSPAKAWATGRAVAHGLLVAALVAIIASLGLLLAVRPFGIGTVMTHGVSMGETVPNGSLALTRETPAESVHEGDIIVVTASAAKVHRVVAIEARDGALLAQTKGDATDAPDPDPYVLTDHTPRVIAVVPFVGFIVAFVMSPVGWFALIAVPAAWLLALFIWGVWARESSERE